MDASDWIAIGAALIALAALALGIVNRRSDIKRQRAGLLRARAWEVLSKEPGLRTVDALDVKGDPETRKILLGRTATELDAVGAGELGDRLRDLLRKGWGDQTTEESTKAREAFHKAVTDFMTAE